MDFDEDPNYLDLNDISAHTQTISCIFLLSIPGLEFLGYQRSEEDAENSQVTLPFWMAKTLYTYSMIDIKLPDGYKPKFIETLAADATIVNLHRNPGPNFYRFGKLLLNLRREKGNNLEPYTREGQRNKFRREEGETLDHKEAIANMLIHTFHSRRHKIIGYSTNGAAIKRDWGSLSGFLNQLDNLERYLFWIGREQALSYSKWKTRKIELIDNVIKARIVKKRKADSNSSNT